MDKFFIKSTTILGALIGFLPNVAIMFGYDFTAADGEAILSFWNELAAFLGFIMVLIGRNKAKGGIRWWPFGGNNV